MTDYAPEMADPGDGDMFGAFERVVLSRTMIARAAAVLNAHRDGIELDEDLAESILRAALEVE